MLKKAIPSDRGLGIRSQQGLNNPKSKIQNPRSFNCQGQPQTKESLAGLLELLADLNLLAENGTAEAASPLPARQQPPGPPPTKTPLQPLPTVGSQENGENKFRPSWTAVVPSQTPVVDQRLASLEAKLSDLEQQVYQPTELINPLLPLIRELLSVKAGESREAILEGIVPVLDEVIRQRSQQAPQKMEAAIAPLLPGSISQEIKDNPHAIARALGPEMGRAIKAQIQEEQEAMVDALYPVIGNTISKYMVEVVKSINEKVETALSFQGVRRRIQAKIQGVSEADLILQEAMDFTVQGIFLIHKTSGLILWETRTDEESPWESELIAGMLTAISDFVRDCITIPGQSSELHEINYDDAKILLEVAGYCYLAVIVRGEPSKPFIANIRHTLGQIVLHYGDEIAAFEGDRTTLPKSAQSLLAKLTEPAAKQKTNKLPVALLLLCLVPLLAGGFWLYRAQVASRLEGKVAEALDAAPELSVYRLVPQVRWGKLKLTGRVPDPYLRELAAQVASQTVPNLALDNQIAAVKVPLVTGMAAAGTRQAISLFNLLNLRLYFAFGSSQLTAEDRSLTMPAIAQFLTQNPELHLQAIGHSDAVGDGKTKEQLALARANAVREALIAQGVAPARLHPVANLSPPPGLTGDSPAWLSRCVRFVAFLPPPVTQK